ncbi:hypothetical protein A2852_01220 [Candidatus Adlerbacteria bacterium RIFCSPHIGHO2_01_FULL_54_23]|uniref:OmpR/PhoB-type domain-containing protein n=3 Tax=Candidatus Adleribacteriota TaxID=1752736 RepID=A0A1F4XZZ1_9BACT|nr:MAG: hypothetical protein UY83_C0006G0071 [Candidatus Adlerbacteria bacterium GW2011_GWA1_54_10]KKW37733.1 MAG: hypothetical protein UY86_C0004G0062 [Candidatus Adlerbacteria bacterium GW2011_GWB1_54_7]OGC79273.1 MAG: hypothetical protein A2852_01220 [Candidatus Adlerbacteria bacterium RIFCSPHIGHO2_01_FULL_54_23]OGC87290.1 MAG: hypothetical protein A3B33_00770 [Candidatus Adlerbacteria bacterium RIFCSPLOWO2_01_FULL_54_16]
MDQKVQTTELHFGERNEISFFPEKCVVICGDSTVALTSQESLFLQTIAENRGRITKKEEILRVLHKHKRLSKKKKQYDVLAHRTRKKLGRQGQRTLVTHKGGYSLRIPEEEYSSSVRFGDFRYFPTVALVKCADRERRLAPERNALLRELAECKGEFVSKLALFRITLAMGRGRARSKMVDVVLCHLREILDDLSHDGGDHIHTKWGSSYGLFEERQPRLHAAKNPRGPHTGILEHMGALRTFIMSEARA